MAVIFAEALGVDTIQVGVVLPAQAAMVTPRTP